MKDDSHRTVGERHQTPPNEPLASLVRRHIKLQGMLILTLLIATIVICLMADTSSERAFNIALFVVISIVSVVWSAMSEKDS